MYDLQSVLSTAGKLSCKRTTLKRCTNIEILLYRKLVSLASPEFSYYYYIMLKTYSTTFY